MRTVADLERPTLATDTSEWSIRPPRALMAMGIAGAVVIFMSLAAWLIVVYPPFLTSDEVFHLDYAWRVGHGELPEFADGATAPGLPAFSPQASFQHPPLFYALLAPIVTPLLDSNRWHGAVMLGRVAVLLLGVLAILAVAWSTRRVLPRPDPTLIVGTAGVAAVIVPLIGVSAAIYNDVLAVLAATTGLGIAATMLRKGPTVGRLAALAAVCAVGFATRASFAVIIVVAAVAVAIAVGRRLRSRHLVGRGVPVGLASAAVVAVPLAAAGWFYARNQRLTGNWTGGQPELAVEILGRQRRALVDVVTDLRVWVRGIGGLLAQPADPAEVFWAVRIAAFAVVLAISGLAIGRAMRRIKRGNVTATDGFVGSILVLALAGAAGQLAVHVSTGGAANARYLLLALLPICLGWAYGLLSPRRARGVIVVAFVAVGSVLLLWQTGQVLQRRVVDPRLSTWEAWTQGADANGVPSLALVGLIASLMLGVGLLAAALWRLSAANDVLMALARLTSRHRATAPPHGSPRRDEESGEVDDGRGRPPAAVVDRDPTGRTDR